MSARPPKGGGRSFGLPSALEEADRGIGQIEDQNTQDESHQNTADHKEAMHPGVLAADDLLVQPDGGFGGGPGMLRLSVPKADTGQLVQRPAQGNHKIADSLKARVFGLTRQDPVDGPHWDPG